MLAVEGQLKFQPQAAMPPTGSPVLGGLMYREGWRGHISQHAQWVERGEHGSVVLGLAYHFIWQRQNGSELTLLSRRGVREGREKESNRRCYWGVGHRTVWRAKTQAGSAQLKGQDTEVRTYVSHLCLVGWCSYMPWCCYWGWWMSMTKLGFLFHSSDHWCDRN